MSQSVTLICTTLPIVRMTLAQKPLIVGRSSQCDVVLNDPTVSRRHARVTRTGEFVIIEDLGSSNGTFVGPERVRKADARHGDLVRFGQVEFEVVAADSFDGSGKDTIRPTPALLAGITPEAELSEAQRRVFEMLFTECTEKEIAQRLGLSRHTVHNHVKVIFRIFNVHSRTELLAAALRSKKAGRTKPGK
ncbi:MAG TPA: FHA domain-containing protein [Gemmatales bacterium]|nr:FHA domain-containing protein [Gemmatales bacterium]HMP61438.1 FHA domain-containing protein [Gemmatales bacterium]